MENLQTKIEEKVMDLMNFGSVGRLIVFKSEKNNFGADLSVERRGKYKESPYFFQVNSFSGSNEKEGFIEDFPAESFRTDKNFYLLFVYFNEVKQKISDFMWLVPSLQFEDIAEVVKLEDGSKVLRFEATLDIKNKDKFSRFLIKTEGLGEVIFEAFQEDGKFNFKEIAFEGSEVINKERLQEFIIEARENTFASNATPIDNPRLLASVQLEFQKGDFFYRDVYFNGNTHFAGQEIIYQSSKPIFAMNYFGTQIKRAESSFLKEALFRLSDKCRFGKVCEYEKREFKYQDQGQGDLEGFSGQEQILVEGKSIYKLDYQGGLISEKL